MESGRCQAFDLVGSRQAFSCTILQRLLAPLSGERVRAMEVSLGADTLAPLGAVVPLARPAQRETREP